MAPSEFMLRQRKLLEDIKKNNGVPPIKSIYTPENYKSLVTLPKLNNAPTGGQTTKINPMDIFDANAKPIELDRTGFIDKVKQTAALRASISDPKKAFNASLPNYTKSTLQTLNNNNTAVPSIKPDQIDSNKITQRNYNTVENPLQNNAEYSLHGNTLATHGKGSTAIQPQLGRGATFEERGFFGNSGREPVGWRGMNPLKQMADSNTLPSKKGLNRHQYQEVLKSSGDLNTQNARNSGALATQELQNQGYSESQNLRNQGSLAEQEIQNEGLQNKAQAKNLKDMKEANIKRLKDRHTLLQERLDPTKFIGSPEEYTTLQDAANKAAIEYERALGSGTRGAGNSQAQKYL